MRPNVLPYVYDAFYPEGWQERQTQDVRDFLGGANNQIFVAIDNDRVVGFVGAVFHPDDSMGEITIVAVDPDHQRTGLATMLMDEASAAMRAMGASILMVETGGDPGHAGARATYERFGFEGWPVAR